MILFSGTRADREPTRSANRSVPDHVLRPPHGTGTGAQRPEKPQAMALFICEIMTSAMQPPGRSLPSSRIGPPSMPCPVWQKTLIMPAVVMARSCR